MAKSEKVLRLFEKHHVLLILGFRFLYGLRTIAAILIGTSGVSPLRFLVLSGLGAAIWATVIGTAGYLFGHTIEIVIGDIKRYQLLVFTVLAGIGVVAWSVRWMARKRANGKTDPNDE